jgi:spore photoproduct lyase
MFKPKRVYFEPQALNYPLDKRLYTRFKDRGANILFTPSHKPDHRPAGETAQQAYHEDCTKPVSFKFITPVLPPGLNPG